MKFISIFTDVYRVENGALKRDGMKSMKERRLINAHQVQRIYEGSDDDDYSVIRFVNGDTLEAPFLTEESWLEGIATKDPHFISKTQEAGCDNWNEMVKEAKADGHWG
jgi:hypothetical protein